MGITTWQDPVFYVASPAGTGEDFFGGQVWISKDDGNTYRLAAIIPEAATHGVADTVLGSVDIVPGLWDETYTVDVFFYTGTAKLQSVTKDQVLHADQNIFRFANGEILGAANVVAQGSDVYRLSSLYRGMRDTDGFMSTHVIGEEVLLLEPTTVIPIGVRLSEVCADPIKIKICSPDVDLADVEEMDFTVDRSSLRPFKPANLVGVFETNGDLTITWDYVTREVNFPILGCEPMRFLEFLDGPEGLSTSKNKFTIEILASAPPSGIVRTLTASGETVTYLDADQETDFPPSGKSTYDVQVRCISEMHASPPDLYKLIP